MLKTNLKDSNQKVEKYKIKKSSRGLKLKNDNGPVIIFIYYYSTPRSVCIARRYIHYENQANLFLFLWKQKVYPTYVLNRSNINPI